MTLSIGIVLGIIFVSFILFVTEKFTVDKTSFFILVSLLIFGIVTPEEAVSGFSDNAVLTILCLMIIAVGLEKNGVIALMAEKIFPITKYPLWIFLPILMITVGVLSSFIATTAVVIIFIKLVNELGKKGEIDRSKVLMPISFAGIIGGSATLMGTSTNLIVSDISRESGVGSFDFFEFSLAGVIFLAVAVPIIYLLARFFLPKDKVDADAHLANKYEYITAVKVRKDSRLVGKKPYETELWDENDIRLLKLQRGKRRLGTDLKSVQIQENDILWLDITIDDIKEHIEKLGLSLLGVDQGLIEDQLSNEYHEVIILPNSIYANMTIEQFNASLPENVRVKGVGSDKDRSKHSLYFNKFVSKKHLIPGNRVLLTGDLNEIQKIARDKNLLFANTVFSTPAIPNYKKVICLISILLIVVLSATNTFSILKSCLIGVGLCLFTGCLQLKDAYEGINWQVIFLLAGMIPLGVAMKNTGTDVYIADHLFALLETVPIAVTVSIVFAFTMLMSGFVSNNATAIILAPIVIVVATNLNINPKPMLYAVMFGSSFSFYTPMGYQTNAIIYGLGIYRFKHFLIVGGVLSLVLLGLASVVLPWLYL